MIELLREITVSLMLKILNKYVTVTRKNRRDPLCYIIRSQLKADHCLPTHSKIENLFPNKQFVVPIFLI